MNPSIHGVLRRLVGAMANGQTNTRHSTHQQSQAKINFLGVLEQATSLLLADLGIGVLGTLASITVDRHAGACCISSQLCVHDTQRSVGIKSVEQGLVDARVRFKIQQTSVPTTPDPVAGSFMHLQMCVYGLSCCTSGHDIDTARYYYNHVNS